MKNMKILELSHTFFLIYTSFPVIWNEVEIWRNNALKAPQVVEYVWI